MHDFAAFNAHGVDIMTRAWSQALAVSGARCRVVESRESRVQSNQNNASAGFKWEHVTPQHRNTAWRTGDEIEG